MKLQIGWSSDELLLVILPRLLSLECIIMPWLADDFKLLYRVCYNSREGARV
jgi:hypothetical protein